ncbi:MAG: hypothetical protein QME63_07210 [Actinomycetota bacterium]|nr:hypothetical protein [Actinomycetota bacterium]
MKKPWYKSKPDFYLLEQKIIDEKYPTLFYSVRDSKVYLSGILNINHIYANEHITDAYEIEIEFPDDYPSSLPKVWELGGRKENTLKKRGLSSILDLHYFSDGSACLCYERAVRRYFPEGSNIEIFLRRLVEPFFYGQSYFQRHGKWPFGEYGHMYEGQGLIQFYSDELNTDDLNIIFNCIKLLAKDEQVKGHWLCPCRSSESLRKCHPELFKRLYDLRKIVSSDDAKLDLTHLAKAYKEYQVRVNRQKTYNELVNKSIRNILINRKF